MKKISIIIPVYNVENYLRKCLDSILVQGFQDYEILLNDDGSKDGTSMICDEYAKKDARIQVFHQENAGVSIARNRMIDRAQGEYILFFDGDDYIEADTLQILWDTAKEQDADSVLYGYNFIPIQGKPEPHLPRFDKELYEGKEILEKVIPRFIGVSYEDITRWLNGDRDALKKENTALWRSMVRSSIIQRNGLYFSPELKVGEDTCFTTEYLSYCSTVFVLNKQLYNLVERESSAIYTYEKNSLAVLQGKTLLLTARRELTDRILERTGFNIEQYWYGTVVMSIIQLSFLLSEKTMKTGYRKLKKYTDEKESIRAVAHMPKYSGGGVRSIPFTMVQHRMFHMLFCSTKLLNIIGYRFER